VHIVSAPPKPLANVTLSIAPFAEGSFALTTKLKSEIEAMAVAIKKSHFKTVDLTGYTDNVFTPAFNTTLNLNRAKAVSARLTLDLVALNDSVVSILIVPGFTVVLAGTNMTAQGRAQNRRVVAVLKAT
jgi:outer membrane protein OmpA-like peptidoglycan-associated protein